MNKRLALTVLSIMLVVACVLALTACKDDHTHSWSEWASDNETTHSRTCACGEVETKDHTFGSWIADGEQSHSRECSVCGKKKTDTHNFVNGVCDDCGYEEKSTVVKTKSVTFDVNGGDKEIKPMQFEVGKVMSNLPAPTRKGYTFICWEDVFGLEYTAASVMPNNDLSLTAKYEKIITSYTDEYVSLKPASQGVKDPAVKLLWGSDDVDEYVYVEITSDDIGGVDKVGQKNNFNLRTIETFEYKIKKSGYTWLWYEGDFNTPNGTQRFTLRYGSNIQLVTVSDSGGTVVKTYLVDIYLKHDYYISFYGNLFAKEPFEKVRVIENERLQVKDIPEYQSNFELDSRVYYNVEKGEYESFVYTTAITQNWNLYLTYKPVTLQTELDGGTLEDDLTITPYTQHFTLPSATKTGYDFFGWKLSNGKYITNIEGYSGLNYLSDENYGNGKLTADFAPKKFYYTQTSEVFETTETIPIVTYTDDTMSEILETLYVVKNTPCPIPTKVPAENGKVFTGWGKHNLNSDNEYSTALSNYEIGGNITVPTALVPVMSATTDNIVALNNTTKVEKTGTYRMYLPARQTYTLKVTTTGNVKFTVICGVDNSPSYTATSSSSQEITVANYYYNLGEKLVGKGYISMSVQSLTGTANITLTGATADRKPLVVSFDLNGGDGSVPSQSVTSEVGLAYPDIPTRDGYSFTGWYTEPECEKLFSFSDNISEDKTLYAGWVQMIKSDYYKREHIDVVNYNSSSKTYSVSTSGSASNRPIYTYFTALTDGNYTLYYKNSSSDYDYGTHVYIYNVTKDAVIMSNKYCNSTSYSSVKMIVSAGDIIYVRNYRYDYSSTFTFYVSGASYPAVGGKSVQSDAVVNLTDSNSCNFGDKLEVTASKPGYTFLGWYDNDKIISDTIESTFEIKTAVKYTAKWKECPAKVVIENTSAGVVEMPTTTKFGDKITLVAKSNEGYTWLGWYVGETKITNESSYTFVLTEEQINYTPKWIECPILIESNNINAGTISMPSTTSIGEKITISATTNNGYTWIGWFDGDKKVTNEFDYIIEITEEPITYTARWSKTTLNNSNKSAGTISSLNSKYRVDDKVVIKAIANLGYMFLGWFKNGEKITNEYEYTVTMGHEDVSYTANWQKDPKMSDFDFVSTPTTCTILKWKNNVAHVSIPSYVTTIGYQAFKSPTDSKGYSLSKLETVTIENESQLLRIGEDAFYRCEKLTQVNLSVCRKLSLIEEGAFRSCDLTSIVVPASVTEIQQAFAYCPLNSIYCEVSAKPHLWDENWNKYYSNTVCGWVTIPVVWGYNNIKSNENYNYVVSGESAYLTEYKGTATEVEIPYQIDGYTVEGFGSIFCKNKSIESVAIPDSVTSIGNYAFSECISLTSVTIGNRVTSIGDWAFNGCSILASITLGNSVTSIGVCAFSECSSLTSITIPNSVTSIGYSAFRDCSSLTSITIPDSVTSLDGAFLRCSSLTSVTIPDSVTSIGAYAFQSCSSLTSIMIPDSVTSIGNFAFEYCSSLKTVYYKGTAEDWTKISISNFQNFRLTSATRYYYSETEPALNSNGTAYDGNYWRYDTDGKTPVVWKKDN